jgi:hypothetical protein
MNDETINLKIKNLPTWAYAIVRKMIQVYWIKRIQAILKMFAEVASYILLPNQTRRKDLEFLQINVDHRTLSLLHVPIYLYISVYVYVYIRRQFRQGKT